MLPVVGSQSHGDLQCLSCSTGFAPVKNIYAAYWKMNTSVSPSTGDADGMEWGCRHSSTGCVLPDPSPPAMLPGPGMGANYSQETQIKAPALGILNRSQRPQGIGLNLPAITGSCSGQCSPSHASGTAQEALAHSHCYVLGSFPSTATTPPAARCVSAALGWVLLPKLTAGPGSQVGFTHSGHHINQPAYSEQYSDCFPFWLRTVSLSYGLAL